MTSTSIAATSASSAGGLRQSAGIALAVAAVPLAGWLFWALVLRLGANDFHDFWLAGRAVASGHSPYDAHALAEAARAEGLEFTVGGGYSYPLPFALAMVPLSALPFGAALVTFNVLSIACFSLTVSGWLRRYDLTGHRALALGLAAAAYPPVYGTVAMGQANLVLLPLLAIGALLVVGEAAGSRSAAGGALLGLAAIVKLVPGALAVPLLVGRRVVSVAGMVAAALASLAVAASLAPWATAGSGGLRELLLPDAYYTNQSLNGFVSRLVLASDRTVPPWPGGFDPGLVASAVTAALALATLAVLWQARAALTTPRGAALGLALGLAAATIGAPKNSFWNAALVLVGVALLLEAAGALSDLRRLGRADLALLAAWYGAAVLWAAVWAANLHASGPAAAGPLAALVTLLWSSSLYGLLALWWLAVRRLRAAAGEAQEATAVPA